MKTTSEDFEPRRDGYFEHVGTWDEVTVGTILTDPEGYRSKAWEVIAQAHPSDGKQIEFGRTLWMRVREVTSGEEHTLPPKMKHASVKILTKDPRDTQTPDPTPASDSEMLALLVEKLGATHLATRDNVTGEITCPDYASGKTHEGGTRGGMADEMEHLRFAHGVDTTRFEEMHWDERIREVTSFHGRLHANREPSPGGFPHRHVPEDLSIFTGKR